MNKIIYIFLGAVIVVGGIVLWSSRDISSLPNDTATTTNPGNGEAMACTQEALMCPDGSGVGRQGPKCEFAPCPNQDSFTGRLEQLGSGFFLIISELPGSSAEEITYSLPLHLSLVSTNKPLSDWATKNAEVTITGTFKTGNFLEVQTINLTK